MAETKACLVASLVDNDERAEALRGMLVSALEQTDTSFHLHLGVHVADKYQAQYNGIMRKLDTLAPRWKERITVHLVPRQSQFRTMKHLFNAVHAQWFFFSDDDDLWAPDRVAMFTYRLTELRTRRCWVLDGRQRLDAMDWAPKDYKPPTSIPQDFGCICACGLAQWKDPIPPKNTCSNDSMMAMCTVPMSAPNHPTKAMYTSQIPALFNKGLAVVKTQTIPEFVCMLVRADVMRAFFAKASDALLDLRVADLYFKSYVLSYQPGKLVEFGTVCFQICQEHWFYFYNQNWRLSAGRTTPIPISIKNLDDSIRRICERPAEYLAYIRCIVENDCSYNSDEFTEKQISRLESIFPASVRAGLWKTAAREAKRMMDILTGLPTQSYAENYFKLAMRRAKLFE